MGFEERAEKKTAQSARGDKKSCEDHRGYKERDRDALRDDLQDLSDPSGEL